MFSNLLVEREGNRKQRRRKFSPEEDALLLSLVEVNGPHRWEDIAAAMPGRSGRQCRDRFKNYLMPSLSAEPWSPEEDRILVAKYQEIGPHWSQIAGFLNGRSSNSVKNRWYTYHEKSTRHETENGTVHQTCAQQTEKSKPKIHVFTKPELEVKSKKCLSQRLLDILIPTDDVVI